MRGLSFLVLLCAATLSAAKAQARWQSWPLTMPIECQDAVPLVAFTPTSAYLADNALLMALAGFVSEQKDRQAILEQFENWGFVDVQGASRSREGVNAIIADHQDFRLVVFRGTSSLEESLADALFGMASYAALGLNGRGHYGMLRHYQKLARQIIPEVISRGRRAPKPLFVTGHSLGGVMAVLAAIELGILGSEVDAVYTSGQPRIGDPVLYDEIEKLIGDRYFRMEHELDPTPRLPPGRDVAGAFAEVLPWDLDFLRTEIENLVQGLSYHRPRGLVLHLGRERGIVNDDGGEQWDYVFWRGMAGSLADVRSIGDIKKRIDERVREHPGRRYVCNFAQHR